METPAEQGTLVDQQMGHMERKTSADPHTHFKLVWQPPLALGARLQSKETTDLFHNHGERQRPFLLPFMIMLQHVLLKYKPRVYAHIVSVSSRLCQVQPDLWRQRFPLF